MSAAILKPVSKDNEFIMRAVYDLPCACLAKGENIPAEEVQRHQSNLDRPPGTD
jgi:hypothetical protein